ncbi:MAG TPA: ABC transporter ATP-binding protein [Nitrososphaerales archaeon]|nr:ABC transporter ATP-binding protein [Nitrososphaerales archaeon]
MANLEIDNISKKYGNTQAVNGVSLKVSTGTFTVILGPSGSGKTTLLRCVAGFEKPDSGSISIDGTPVTDLPPRERDLAMVFQSYALFPLMTIHDNIGFPLKVRNVPKAEIDARVKEVAELLVIKHLLDKKPNQLSGGEQQRAALGRAIVRRPNALLMDEPLTSLDAPLRAQMRTELKRIRRETQITALYVTHDQAEAMGLADMIAIMSQGELMQYGPPLDVYSNPKNSFVAGFVGNPPTNILNARFSVAGGGGILKVDQAAIPVDASMANMMRDKVGDGTEVLVGIRPEDIKVFSSKRSESDLEIVVESFEPLGSSTVVSSLVDGKIFRLVLPPEHAAAAGDHLWLEWEANKMHIFEKSGGLLT